MKRATPADSPPPAAAPWRQRLEREGKFLAATHAHEASLRVGQRASADASARRLEVREEREVWEGLLREVRRELGPAASDPQTTMVGQGPPAAAAATVASQGGRAAPQAASRAESIAALVERIERTARQGLPGLDLALGGGPARRVEIRREGPGAVTVRLIAATGAAPRLRAEAGVIAEELAARGLKVVCLRVD